MDVDGGPFGGVVDAGWSCDPFVAVDLEGCELASGEELEVAGPGVSPPPGDVLRCDVAAGALEVEAYGDPPAAPLILEAGEDRCELVPTGGREVCLLLAEDRLEVRTGGERAGAWWVVEVRSCL